MGAHTWNMKPIHSQISSAFFRFSYAFAIWDIDMGLMFVP
jgi:hypothetical protein